ncbi:AAA family ATPase [Polymorphospora lycopeni]|uniref:ATP-binding protein n=1 Tax=Polymorphospora lycopeni TaxID=3140240 RepID=A0ABV5D2I8_9ACTN
MAKIRHAQIVGLAGREGTFSVDFNEDLNIFWGMNGSGKTSFLKILHSALTGDPSYIVRVPFKSASVTFEVSSGERYTRTIRKTSRRPSKRELEFIEDLAASGQAVEEFMLMEMSRQMAWKTEPEGPVRRLRHGYLPISRMTDLVRGSRHVSTGRRDVGGLLDEAQIDEEFARQTLALWREYNNQALIKIRRAQEQGLAEVLSAILTGERSRRRTKNADTIPSDLAFTLVTSFFQQQRISPQLSTREKFQENYEKNALLRDVVARIADVEVSIRMAQEPQRRLTNLLSSLFSRGKEVVLDSRSVAVRVGREEIPIESLSSGEKQIVRILLECLAAGNHCILIDEPELSLHVDWQHRLVESMRAVNDEVQIILATHSPEVMAEIPNSRVFEL